MSQVKNLKRAELLRILNGMPDEAFSYFVLWAAGGFGNVTYPDGLGGFRPESKLAIEELRKAAAASLASRQSEAVKSHKTPKGKK